ncbi:variant surface glycoprotein (VSG), putative [Trypanosoma brucei gambiense DAL972]|uniref:Variant surface glycoprotein (VSG), putative n=1 Tax=Trypanosoma brucei gambiense (strain MHOM/CI/86/DAL972) TaxID=679716 RepID=C9ZX44_TRYB9|nr:variant surface glycoprotein (VSG), putative [Trypanosoma brucei gambiense DAL972]CBH13985.1 variant surface glycoprotein (VSG), putative [Trypanosoma brucei gambiense DAL972]|eukprot:XP_011776259.1 variant surface glycoprotein (VSG), putative [Trypanosoma brucei gambiense DAL972]
MRHSNAASCSGPAILALVLIFKAVSSEEITGTGGASTAFDNLAISIQLAESFKTKVSTGRSRAKALQNRAFLWQIASEAKPDTAKKHAKQALQLMFQQRSRTQLEDVEAVEAGLQQAAKILDARATAIYTANKLQSVVGSTKASPTATNLASHGATAAACTIAQQLKTSTETCDETKINSKPAAVGTSPAEADKQIKLLGDAYLQKVSLKTKAVAVGGENTHTNIATPHEGDCANGAQGQTDASHLLGVDIEAATPPPTLAAKDIKQAQSGTKQCRHYGSNDKWYAPTEEQTLSAICAGLTTTLQEQQTEEKTCETLARNLTMIKLAAQLLMDEKALSKITAGDRAAKIADLIKQSHGAGPNDFKNNYLNELDKATVKFKIGETEETQSVKSISSKTDADVILSYLIVRRQQNSQAAQKQLESEKEKATGTKPDTENKTEKKDGKKKDECTGTVETDCDKTKCEWNAGKKQCKVKEGAVVSSMIKTPLLFAFSISN